jgi:hypothetical protein
MTDEQIKAIEDKCKIKSKEQFVEECRKAGFPDDWYTFTCDRSVPVSIEGDSVYYGKIGITSCAVIMCIWDVAFEQLLKYKKEYDWEQTGVLYRIDRIAWEGAARISRGTGNLYPYVTIWDVSFTDHPDPKMLEDGWIFDNYDHYMGYCNYHKVINVRSIKGEIVFRFTKRTEDRDRKEFGFTDDYLTGSYHYLIPDDLKDEVARSIYRGDLSDQLKEELRKRFEPTLIEDEFKALVRLRDEHKKALFGAIDKKLTVDEQKKAFADAGNAVEDRNPAGDNYHWSRSYLVTHKNFDLAYEKAGIR